MSTKLEPAALFEATKTFARMVGPVQGESPSQIVAEIIGAYQGAASDRYLRDRYAGEALNGFASAVDASGLWQWTAEQAAWQAFECADAMMAERAKRDSK